MRKIPAFMLSILIFLILGGCGKNKELLLAESFSSKISFENNDIYCEGFFSADEEGNMKFVVEYPSSLSGVEFLYRGNQTTVSCEEVTVNAEVNVLSPINAVFSAFKATKNEMAVLNETGIQLVEFTDENIGYRVTVNCDEKRVTNIESDRIKITFFDLY